MEYVDRLPYLGVPDDFRSLLGIYYVVTDAAYGATGDGSTDDRAAIQAAINAAIAGGGGVVFFPPGVYSCMVAAGIPVFQLSGSANGKLIFMGCGRSSRIVMSGDGLTTDRRLFDIKAGCKYVGFKNLSFNSALTHEYEQQHLLHWESSNALDPETGRSFVIDCYFGHTKGDAIRFLGSDTKRVANVLVKRCVFEMASAPGSNSRSALSFQRSTDDVTIDACYATADASDIDFEPTGTGSNERNRIMRNHFIGTVTLSGNGSGQEHIRSIFARNTVLGTVSGLDIEDLDFVHNIVEWTGAGAYGLGVLGFQERIHNLLLSGNFFYRSGDTLTPSTVAIEYHSVGENNYLVIDGNIIVNANNSTDGVALSLRDASSSVVSNNLTTLGNSVANRGSVIRCEATTEAIADNTMVGNLGIGTNAAVKQFATDGGGNFNLADNMARNCNGALTTGSTKTEQYQAGRNAFLTASGGISLTGGTPTYINVDGSGNVGPTIYEVTVTPEANVPAVVGSIALRVSGGGAGTTFYVKESGASSTGWVGK